MKRKSKTEAKFFLFICKKIRLKYKKMEFLIKQEPCDKSLTIINETTSCCNLCHDGDVILREFFDHLSEKHFEGKKNQIIEKKSLN